MTDNENMVINEVTPPEEGKKKVTWASFVAGLKEWFRKKIVNLKRRPSNIAFLMFVVTSLMYMIAYTSIARMLYSGQTNSLFEWSALCSFVTFLFSILILVLFMQAFPKRKKPSVVMLVLVAVFLAVMILTDVICYMELQDVISGATEELTAEYYSSENILLAHIIMLGISAVLLALTPVFKILLMKINTRKEVESTVSEMKVAIDLEETE